MKATIKSEPGMPINMNAFPTGQMQHLEHVQKERSLKKRRLDLEKEELQLGKQELQLKRRELKFEEEEAAIERVGKMAAVVEDEDEVTFLSEKQVNRDAQNSMTNEGVEVELAASKDNQSTIVAKSFVDGTARESSKSVSETCRNEQVATAEDTRASQPPKQESRNPKISSYRSPSSIFRLARNCHPKEYDKHNEDGETVLYELHAKAMTLSADLDAASSWQGLGRWIG